MDNALVLTVLTAILVFMAIYYSTLARHDGDEAFNTPAAPNPVLAVAQEIEKSVTRLNNDTEATTAAISNALVDMRRNVEDNTFNTTIKVQGMHNELLNFQNALRDMDSRYVKREALSNYMLDTQMQDRLEHRDTILRTDLASRRYVNDEFVPVYKFNEYKGQVKAAQDALGLDVTGLNTKQNEMRADLATYATRAWAAGQFAAAGNLTNFKNTQDMIIRDYAQKTDLAEMQVGVTSALGTTAEDVAKLRRDVELNNVTHTGLQEKLNEKCAPLESHNRVSRVVNDTLVGLNQSLLNTIGRDSNKAAYTSLVLMESKLNKIGDDVDDVRRNMAGITSTTLDRNEITLGNYLLSGVESGGMIRVFNKENTVESGGLSTRALEAQHSLVSNGTTTLMGAVNLGTETHQPINVNGYANVRFEKGNVMLLGPNAQHKVNGTLTVNSLKAKSLVIDDKVLDPNALGNVQAQINSMQSQLNVLSAAKEAGALPVIKLYEGINKGGEPNDVGYSIEELDANWVDRISCIVVSPGVKVTLYAKPHFEGAETRMFSNYSLRTDLVLNLRDYPLPSSATKTWDTAVKSIRVEKL